MTKKEETIKAAEQLVSDILRKDFRQSVDQETVRLVAVKVAKAVPVVREPASRPAKARERVTA